MEKEMPAQIENVPDITEGPLVDVELGPEEQKSEPEQNSEQEPMSALQKAKKKYQNSDKHRATRKTYYERNREKCLEHTKKYQKKRKEQQKMYEEFYKKHKDNAKKIVPVESSSESSESSYESSSDESSEVPLKIDTGYKFF